eukprot:CAMPEP_0196681900 /NCGR_PEP_ID=MMETSP1090-20130531/8847_1 /TAXON_ID=37098 /ORGANISM="Isochrysis sp, Strain CCMP1244" /LENGTH=156 /DNA_ID=CAMNT_0042020293 /DNA_START=203 /DNA_END=673 /DNA_ORIENTATION=-
MSRWHGPWKGTAAVNWSKRALVERRGGRCDVLVVAGPPKHSEAEHVVGRRAHRGEHVGADADSTVERATRGAVEAVGMNADDDAVVRDRERRIVQVGAGATHAADGVALVVVALVVCAGRLDWAAHRLYVVGAVAARWAVAAVPRHVEDGACRVWD